MAQQAVKVPATLSVNTSTTFSMATERANQSVRVARHPQLVVGYKE
jgi:hypothetical protein